MERTRHITATMYVVNDGAVALHDHKRHDLTIPPGGHVDRGELPHEAGLREVREEMGLDPTLVDDTDELPATNVETLPRPRHTILVDVNEHDGTVTHQHVDLIYFATVPTRDVDPGDDEVDADAWTWFTPAQLRAADLGEDVVHLGVEAIETVA